MINRFTEYRTCTKCGRTLPKTVEFFSKHHGHKDGLSSQCKECKNERNRLYKKKNIELIKLDNKEYYQENLKEIRERHRIYQHHYRAKEFSCIGSYTPLEWNDCLEFFSFRCAYTGELLNENNLTADHIIALSNMGTNYIWNICPSVNYANFSKADNEIEEWYRKQSNFSEKRLQKIYSWIEYAKFMY